MNTSFEAKIINIMQKIVLTLLLLNLSLTSVGQPLERRAYFESKIAGPASFNPGATITEIIPSSPLDKAGLKTGDVILNVDGRAVLTSSDWSAILFSLSSTKRTQLIVKRGVESMKTDVQLSALPLETNANVETLYETIVNDYGMRQRAIITIPKNGKSKHPAIILIQGLSCSSVEKYSGRSNNWVKQIQDLAEKSNMVLYRIEKPGVGDSEGDCGQIDFLTELNGYETAIKALKSKPYVDTNKIVIYGNSMGSALAPYIANTHGLAGVISDGTFFKSWYEHMLEIERRILEIEGKSQKEIYHLMNTVYIPLYYEMLVKKRSFDAILKDHPTFKPYHRQGLHHMYGRPMVYYHQMQDFNFAEHWEQVTVPVRIRWGTNDWIMTEHDNDMIISVLENAGHTNHKLLKYKDLDHWSTIHPNYNNSFYFKPGKWEDAISQQIIDWAWEIVDSDKN